MKVKELDITANVAWSPSSQYPIYLATGTAAQQLDATFSTSAALDIYSLNLNEPGLAMEKKASLDTSMRFHKLLWGSHGIGADNADASGLIIGGTDNGRIYLYDAQKILQNKESLVEMIEKHTGTVRALDANPFQANLLASGASDSEIFIWDLNNTGSPMTPGAKSQPLDEISCLAWNRQVQHILASTCPGGRCVVWDLRKNEPIIKVTDHSSRMRCKVVAWHPEVATQMALASEDDHSPVIQMWDLRFATSPLKVLENHQRGILSIAWCPQDCDLLLSCGKDNRILCWNPNSAIAGGEVTYELPTSSQWCFDVQWCPRNPSLISTSSFDGHVSVHSLLGGSFLDNQQSQQQSNVASSFPGMDPYSQAVPQQQPSSEPVILKRPPKWLRRPVGASFAFGGKLVSFENTKPQQPHQQISRQVKISQVVTETDFINRSKCLENALSGGNFVEFCSSKIAQSEDEIEKQMWDFLKVNFEKEPRNHFISLLGHDSHDLTKKVAMATGAKIGLQNGSGKDINLDEVASKMESISTDDDSSDVNIGSGTASPSVGSKTPSDVMGDGDGAAAFDAIAAGGPIEVENRPDGSEADLRPESPYSISKNEDANGLLSKALLTGNFEAAVEMCLHDDRLADAIILAIAGGPELLARTQRKYFKKNKSDISRLISSIVTRDLSDMVKCCELDNWKEVLTALLTYATAEEFPTLCNSLGLRLESEGAEDLVASACLCYICAGNVEKLVSCWCKFTPNGNSALGLQDLVEKVMILREAVAKKQGYVENGGSVIAQKLSSYAQLLASQGSLATAVNYLRDSNEPVVAALLERLYKAQGQTPSTYNQQNRTQVVKPTVNQGLNSFKTTTTSSSVYYNSQVSSQTQPSNAYYNPAATQGYTNNTPVSAPAQKSTNIYSNKGLSQRVYPKQPTQNPTAPSQYYQPTGASQTYANTAQPGFNNPTQPAYSNPAQTSFYNPSSYTQPIATTVPTQPYQTQNPSQAVQSPSVSTNQMPANQPIATAAPPRPKQEEGAWNDPPLVKQKEKRTYVAPTPITAPIIGGAAPASQPDMNQAPPGGQTGYAQQAGYNQQMMYSSQGQQTQTSAPAAQKAEPVEKEPAPRAPIPAEHQVLNQVFETLKDRCIQSAGMNAQIKRKLDDVTKKLNALYDKLSENSLSPNILQGLHQIAQCIGSLDYNNGLEVYKQLVSSGNFSEISTFMPGLKVLMQVAAQIRV